MQSDGLRRRTLVEMAHHRIFHADAKVVQIRRLGEDRCAKGSGGVPRGVHCLSRAPIRDPSDDSEAIRAGAEATRLVEVLDVDGASVRFSLRISSVVNRAASRGRASRRAADVEVQQATEAFAAFDAAVGRTGRRGRDQFVAYALVRPFSVVVRAELAKRVI